MSDVKITRQVIEELVRRPSPGSSRAEGARRVLADESRLVQPGDNLAT